MLKNFLRTIKTIKEARSEAKNLIEYINRDLVSSKQKHIIHLNRYFLGISGLNSKLNHRWDTKQLSSVYSLCGVDVELCGYKCLGSQPYKVLSKKLTIKY